MTDKDKLAKVRAEIERVKKNQEGVFTSYTDGKFDLCEHLLSFIDSLQKEPKFKLGDIVRRKSDGLQARVINIVDGTYIVECEDWNDSILEYQWELVEEHK